MNKLNWTTVTLWIGLCWLLPAIAQADSLQAQRERYAQARQAFDQHQLAQAEKLLPGLQQYPLYPYLQYQQITARLTQISPETVSQFIATHHSAPFINNLISRFVNELARRDDWQGILTLSPTPPTSDSAQCQYYNAKWHTGLQQEAWQGARSLWLSGKDNITACYALFSAWQASGDITLYDYQQRILNAIRQGNWKQVRSLSENMPNTSTDLTRALISLSKTPDDLLSFTHAVPKNAFTHNIIASVFARLARKDSVKSQQLLSQLETTLPLTLAQHQRLNESQAWQLMTSRISPSQAQWRDQIIQRSHSNALIERRIRLALTSNNWQELAQWLAYLPAEEKTKDEWRYWQAIILQQQGQHQQAETLLLELTHQRGFYPMVAAQRLGKTYRLNIKAAPEPQSAILHKAADALARIQEFKYWKQENNARREWNALTTQLTAREQASLAHYASEQQWWYLSVQATIAGKLWDHLQQRFPLAYPTLFQQYLADKTISQSYAMAIARQESAWNPQARSSAGAIGLMQLMPATAKYTAQKNHITDYQQPSQLLNPATNIKLGTAYLQLMYQQFGENRILATAAYNAGPSRVRSWLNNSNGKLDAIAFIESIPFTETRNYVKNVLAYNVYYQHFLHQSTTQFLTDAEWQTRY